MSVEDLETVANLILKPHQKTENKRAWISIFGWAGLILTIGFTGGNWVYWRSAIEEWKIEQTKTTKFDDGYIQGEQAVKNAEQAKKNEAVIVKSIDK
jgi:uncharacterized protein YfdQ (DUF2303 family)